MNTEQQAVATLEAAGFTAAATLAKARMDMVRRLALAYEHFRYVTAQQIAAFNERLKAATNRPAVGDERHAYSAFGMLRVEEVADQLRFVDANAYTGVPPAEVLAKVSAAKDMGVFDGFTVASIETVATKSVPFDPIVFGLVAGCTDRFFIAEWGTDVKLADIIGPSEG